LALESSGWSRESRAKEDLALVVGTMLGGAHTIGDFDRTALVSGAASVSPMAFANTVINAAAGQTAIWHNLRGANSTVATGSISGISAVGHGTDLIRCGRSKALVAGGVDEFSDESFRGFDLAGLLCSNGACHECPVPFDLRRNGFALGEGSGFLVLEELTYANARGARILAEVKGYASAFDSSQGKDPDQAVGTLVRTMHTAMNRAGVTQHDIDFISASGNGSVTQDSYELDALATVFGGRAKELPVTAIKSAIAEALGGSGPTQIAVAIETLHNQLLPGIIGLQELAPTCPLQSLSSKTQTIKAHSALINGVGLDGNCCSIVVAVFDA
jgi:3-oxoacyl-[acyl-carrier-protein] synthase II